MPKISTPLSDTAIKNLKPKDKLYKKSDGKNLFIFVAPNGRKYFAFEFKSPATNKIRRLTLGDYPDLSLSRAREKRRELMAEILNGNDPIITKNAHKNTLNEVAFKWLEIKSATISPNYYNKQILIYNKHISPFLGGFAVNEIKAVQIIETLKKIEKSGNYETIKRVYALLNQIYKYALTYEFTAHNIIADINYKYAFKTPKARHYPTLTSQSEIKNLLVAINEYNGSLKTKIALKLAIYTAMRPFNIRHATWGEFDLNAKIWHVKAEKIKTKESFSLPLSDSVVAMIKEYKELIRNNSDYLFCSELSKDKPMSENTLNTALRRLGYSKDELVSHGFRAMFSTMANEKRELHAQGVDIIERCLAHKDTNKIRAAYNRATNLNQMRKLMQWWSDFLDSLNGG